MGNVLEIPSPRDPGNTLIIQPVPGSPPDVPQANDFSNVQQLTLGEDPCDCFSSDPLTLFHGYVVLIHDAVTGLWVSLVGCFEPVCGAIDETGRPDTPAPDAETIANAYAASHLTIASAFPPFVAQFYDPEELADWDYFFYGCCDPTVVNLFDVWTAPKKTVTCPAGQAFNAAGQCVPVDPPVPALVRNLGEPTRPMNPVTRGTPTPFVMKDCGCGIDDPEEIPYGPSLSGGASTSGNHLGSGRNRVATKPRYRGPPRPDVSNRFV